MSKSKPFVTCGLLLVSLTALLSWSVPCRADDPEPAEAIRQIGIMARVLETRLNEEMPGAIVGGSIFQPGGVRGFRVPGVGVVFEINVNFPVVEPKPGERPSAAAKNEDLWNRIERGEIVGPGVVEGMSPGYFYYAPVPAASPAAPVAPSSAAPAAPDAPAPPHAPARSAPPHAPGAPVPPHASATPAPPHAPGAPAPPHAPGDPMQPHAAVGSGTSGFGGGGGYGSVSVAGTGYGASMDPYYAGRDPRRNVAALERVILDVLARYGERLKAIPADENIIVLVAGGGGRGRAAVSYSYVRQPAPSPAQPLATLKDLDDALENMKDQMKAAEERMRDAQAQMGAAAAQKAQAQQSDNAAAIEQAEAQVQAAKDRIQAAAQQIRAAGEQVKATGERAKAAQSTRSRPPRRAANVAQQTATGMSYGVAEVGAPGGGSWVLKVKKGDLASDPDQLRKRVVIESY